MTYAMTDAEPPPFPRGAFFRVWIAPRRTVRAIIDSESTRGAWIIAAFLGIGRFDPGASPTATAVFGVLLFSLVVGIPAWLIGSVILSWVGQKFGGSGDLEDLKIAVAWGSIPAIVAQGLALGARIVANSIASCAVGLLMLAVIAWGLVVYVRAVAEAHSVSSWRGLVIVLVPAVPLLVIAAASWLARSPVQ